MRDKPALRGRRYRNRQEAGQAAESAAADYLLNRGYTLISRNWRCRSGEIDLIMEDGTTLVFIEVRSRTAPSRYGTAVEAISPRKCRQVRATASVYLRMHNVDNRPVRFDVAAVTFGPGGEVVELRYLPNAF